MIFSESTCDILFASGSLPPRWGSSFCYGAAHPICGGRLSVYSLDALHTPLPIDRVLGQEALSALHEGATRYLSQNPDEREALAESANPTDWAICRRNGRWILQGLLGYSAELYRGTYAIFDIPFKAPEALVEYDMLKPSWTVIKREIPEAVDAFSSSRGNLLVVQIPDRLLFYGHPSKDSVGRPVGQMEIPPGAQAVVIQWAVGS
ncbi:MAG: hypothetical protein GX493_00895, partial [Firmicutes bacterium]|nr:hypothetical protein [Bacillota bacterium]